MSHSPLPPPVYTPPPARKGGMSAGVVVGIVLGMLVLGGGLLLCVSLGIMLPALGKAREAARLAKSGITAMQASTALLAYANDNRDFLPEPDADWEARLADMGLISPGSLRSPRADDDWTGTSYFLVPLGRVSDVADPTKTVLLYENPTLLKSAGDKGVVVFVDGHVETIPRDQFLKLIDALTLPDGTPFAPHRDGSP